MTPHDEPFSTRPIRRVRVRDEFAPPDAWPANIPAVAQLLDEGLDLPEGITFLVGENGSGKSTIVEAVAMAYGLAAEGGGNQMAFSTRESESPLHQWLTLERSPGQRQGFFLRAETMHGFYTRMEEIHATLPNLHAMSHGESFLTLLAERFRWPGFYCLDEPEAALSFSSTLALMGTLNDVVDAGGQVLCATHSPLLAATPGATILEVGDWGVRPCAWEDLTLVAVWKNFLNRPESQLRHLALP